VLIQARENEQIELQAKLLNYFLGSNKSNINQMEKERESGREREREEERERY